MADFFDQKNKGVNSVERLEEALERFVTDGMAARNYSQATRTSYLNDLQLFLQYMDSIGVVLVAKVRLADLESYQAQMDRQGYAPSSRERKTHAIKSFFEFLERQEIVSQNPANKLIPPSYKRDERRFLTKGEYQRLLREVSHNPRDAAIIELFLQTGIRLSELARLSVDDLNLPNKITRDPDNVGQVRIRRKGGRYETLPLNYKACKAVAAYLKVRPGVSHRGLFVTKFGLQMGKRGVQNVVTKYLKEAGIKDASTHTLRHTMATHHAANGTDLPTIQNMLGHQDLKTTSIYVSLAKEAQKRALQENAL